MTRKPIAVMISFGLVVSLAGMTACKSKTTKSFGKNTQDAPLAPADEGPDGCPSDGTEIGTCGPEIPGAGLPGESANLLYFYDDSGKLPEELAGVDLGNPDSQDPAPGSHSYPGAAGPGNGFPDNENLSLTGKSRAKSAVSKNGEAGRQDPVLADLNARINVANTHINNFRFLLTRFAGSKDRQDAPLVTWGISGWVTLQVSELERIQGAYAAARRENKPTGVLMQRKEERFRAVAEAWNGYLRLRSAGNNGDYLFVYRTMLGVFDINPLTLESARTFAGNMKDQVNRLSAGLNNWSDNLNSLVKERNNRIGYLNRLADQRRQKQPQQQPPQAQQVPQPGLLAQSLKPKPVYIESPTFTCEFPLSEFIDIGSEFLVDIVNSRAENTIYCPCLRPAGRVVQGGCPAFRNPEEPCGGTDYGRLKAYVDLSPAASANVEPENHESWAEGQIFDACKRACAERLPTQRRKFLCDSK